MQETFKSPILAVSFAYWAMLAESKDFCIKPPQNCYELCVMTNAKIEEET